MGLDMNVQYDTKKEWLPWYEEPKTIRVEYSQICIYQGQDLKCIYTTTAKYLGHIINNNMSDVICIGKRRKLYAQTNMLVRKCYVCFRSGKDKPF